MLDTEDQYTYASWSTPLRWTGRVFHFGVLAPLALLGVLLTWNQRGRIWLLHLLLVLYMASVVMFYVVARYRFPMVPFLVLFAAAGLAGIPGFLRAGVPSADRGLRGGGVAGRRLLQLADRQQES